MVRAMLGTTPPLQVSHSGATMTSPANGVKRSRRRWHWASAASARAASQAERASCHGGTAATACQPAAFAAASRAWNSAERASPQAAQRRAALAACWRALAAGGLEDGPEGQTPYQAWVNTVWVVRPSA